MRVNADLKEPVIRVVDIDCGQVGQVVEHAVAHLFKEFF